VSQALPEQHIDEPMSVTHLSREGWGRLAMWLFLASDGMTFSGLLMGHLVLRAQNTNWPSPADHLALTLGVVMTALLLGSSVTMVKALVAVRENARQRFSRFLLLTIIAGVLFLVLQAYEWNHLLHAGMTASTNPWGAPLFGATFYTLTGFHGLHVLGGVMYLSCILLSGRQKTVLASYHDRVEIAGLYWHFVDVVWIFVFSCVYVL
jgi:heme/copper-type cytochrome/quinol oxidase subunit 3